MSADAAEVVEQMLRECVPGGSSCDPQQVADAIREWFANMETRPCCELAALKASNAELRALVAAVVDNRGACFIPEADVADALYRWTERATEALARNKTQGEQQ